MAIVTFVALLVFLGLAVLFGYPLVNGITHFAHALPGYVSQAQHGKGWIGRPLSQVPRRSLGAAQLQSPHVARERTRASPRWPWARARSRRSWRCRHLLLRRPVVDRGAEDPSVAHQAGVAERAKRYRHIGRIISRSVSGYVLGDMMTSITAGFVVFVTLLIVGVPYAFLWALWVALVDFLPTIGGALAGIPTVLFAFAHSLHRGTRDA